METIVGGKTGRAIKVDDNHRLHTFGVILAHGHHEIHEGCSFVASQTQTTAVADDNMTVLTLLTDDDYETHMFYRVSVTAAGWFYIYEGSTVANDTGTASVTVYNRNRFSKNTSKVWDTKKNPDSQGSIIYWDETDAAGANLTLAGTLIYQEQIGAGRTSAAVSRSDDEFILKPGTVYAFVLENEGAAANIHNIVLNWYEEKI